LKAANILQDLIYLEYLEIPPGAYQNKVRYYEKHERALNRLPFDVLFEIRIDYSRALFASKEYMKFLVIIDKLIETTITSDIFELNGVDIYLELLHKKAKAAYFSADYKTAEFIFSELIKIKPEDNCTKKEYFINAVEYLRYQGQSIRATIILLFLFSGILIAFELFIVRTVFVDQTWWFEYTRNTIMVLGITLFALNEAKIRFAAKREYKKLAKTTKPHVIY